jgi:hypothetical protein
MVKSLKDSWWSSKGFLVEFHIKASHRKSKNIFILQVRSIMVLQKEEEKT